jgi:hypothetical protein
MNPRLIKTGCLSLALLMLALSFGCNIKPTPVPPPPPGPVVTTDAVLVVIEETAERTPAAAGVLGDIAFWNGLGAGWRFYDDDSPDARAYLPMVADRPGLIVLDKSGKKVWSGPLPKTTDEIRKLVASERSRND